MTTVLETFQVLADTLRRAGVTSKVVIKFKPGPYFSLLTKAMGEVETARELGNSYEDHINRNNEYFELAGIRVELILPVRAYHPGVGHLSRIEDED